MTNSYLEKKKILPFENLNVEIKSLTLDELSLVLKEMKEKGEFEGIKLAIRYGIVSPSYLRENPGLINAEIAVLISAEIFKLTGLAHQKGFNPSQR